MNRTKYEDLVLSPHFVAGTVIDTVYDGSELSNSSPIQAAKLESVRQGLPEAHRKEFVTLTDNRCRAAYEVKADWFMKCIRSRSNAGRDQLYIWVTHFLASYLHDPESLRRKAG